MRHFSSGLLLVLLLGVYAGCADTAGVVRQVTYLDDFNYVSKTELESTMHDLWRQIRALYNALAEPVENPDVIAILDRLRKGAATLQAGPGGSNYPVLQHQLGEFRQQLARARRAALARPPSYQPALAVVDGCVRRHTLHR